MNYIDEIILFTCQQYGVDFPRYLLNCERYCNMAHQCRSSACYLPSMRIIFFRGSSPPPNVVFHEVGHHVHSVKNNVKRFFTYKQAAISEKFANEVEEWGTRIWEQRKFFGEIAKNITVTLGTLLVTVPVTLLLKELWTDVFKWLRIK